MGVYDYNKEAVENLKIDDPSILDSPVNFESARKATFQRIIHKKTKGYP